MVIKNLPEDVTEQEVAAELARLNIRAQNVHQFNKRDRLTKKLIPQPTYSVTLPRDPQSEKIYDLQYMFTLG